jgi:Stress-induced bacterial acidophilic repeat motif
LCSLRPKRSPPWPHKDFTKPHPSRFEHLKPLSSPSISSLGLCYSSREEMMALAIEMPKKLTSTRGFAAMDREKQLAIARKGAKAYQTKSAVFRKIADWRPRPGERGDRVSIPQSAAFRAITRHRVSQPSLLITAASRSQTFTAHAQWKQPSCS